MKRKLHMIMHVIIWSCVKLVRQKSLWFFAAKDYQCVVICQIMIYFLDIYICNFIGLSLQISLWLTLNDVTHRTHLPLCCCYSTKKLRRVLEILCGASRLRKRRDFPGHRRRTQNDFHRRIVAKRPCSYSACSLDVTLHYYKVIRVAAAPYLRCIIAQLRVN